MAWPDEYAECAGRRNDSIGTDLCITSSGSAILVGCLCWAGRVPMPSASEALPFLVRVLVLLLLLDFSLFSACMVLVILFRDTAKTMALSALFLMVVCWTMPALEQSLAKAPGTIYPLVPTTVLLLHPAVRTFLHCGPFQKRLQLRPWALYCEDAARKNVGQGH